jgi:hypothetical protein
VLFNLAVNARDAIDGSGTLLLRTRAATFDRDEVPGLAAGAYVELEVTDWAAALIARSAGAHLFEPFFTTKPERGTGLGLASAYGILRQSGGDIRWRAVRARARPSACGCRARASSPSPTKELVPAEAPRGGFRETVLLVEDEPAVRALAQRVLARAPAIACWPPATAPRPARTRSTARPPDRSPLVRPRDCPAVPRRESRPSCARAIPSMRLLVDVRAPPGATVTAERALLPEALHEPGAVDGVRAALDQRIRRRAGRERCEAPTSEASSERARRTFSAAYLLQWKGTTWQPRLRSRAPEAGRSVVAEPR